MPKSAQVEAEPTTDQPHVPMLHETVKDVAGNIGEVMDHVGGAYQLRPIGGGKERDVPESQIRVCPPEEALRHKVAVANARSSGKCLSSDS